MDRDVFTEQYNGEFVSRGIPEHAARTPEQRRRLILERIPILVKMYQDQPIARALVDSFTVGNISLGDFAVQNMGVLLEVIQQQQEWAQETAGLRPMPPIHLTVSKEEMDRIKREIPPKKGKDAPTHVIDGEKPPRGKYEVMATRQFGVKVPGRDKLVLRQEDAPVYVIDGGEDDVRKG